MTTDAILTRVAASFDITVRDILSRNRARHIVDARHAAIAVLHSRFPRWSLITLGEHFGGLDHSTVLNALTQVQKRRAVDPRFDALLKELEAHGR